MLDQKTCDLYELEFVNDKQIYSSKKFPGVFFSTIDCFGCDLASRNIIMLLKYYTIDGLRCYNSMQISLEILDDIEFISRFIVPELESMEKRIQYP